MSHPHCPPGSLGPTVGSAPSVPGSGPRGRAWPSTIGKAETQALGNLQDPRGQVSSRELCPRKHPGGGRLRTPPASEHVQEAPACCRVWGHTGNPWPALPHGPPCPRHERDMRTDATHAGSEEGLQDRCPGHTLQSTPPVRQINLIITTNDQRETGTRALYCLPQILSDKIRDWVSVSGTAGIFHPENHE